ncbi:LuxR C-terminal-related transcriptional regulator [Mycobacterium sp. SMC-4]|uniref:LuxR C-terminal-related transcriptional regulator n=1 Tax=Mycobacterium sp. SMC-4 TaxID=2857059 RepID=UPI003D080236
MRLTWPLVGRTAETRRITDALLDPNCAGLVVSGAAGVGKSRLVRETFTELATAGWQTCWVAATSAARTLPLGAMTPWVPSTTDDGREMIRSVVERIGSAPDGRPAVLCVDDAPLLDDLSTIVVQQVVQRGSAKVILTLHEDDPVPPATRELWKIADFDRLRLQPLTEDHTASLITRTLHSTTDYVAVQRLWEMTRGNPLYLRNIVDQEVADGRLCLRDGVWMWGGDPVLPPNLVELVESRLGAMSGAVEEVIDALAVGEPLELRALVRIAGSDAVEEADRRGLISYDRIQQALEVRLAHPLYGEVRKQCAPQATLRRLRGMVATELAASDKRDELQTVVRRAKLSIDSDLEPGAELLLEAARGAAWMLDLSLAEELSSAAITLGAGPQAHLVRAFVLSWSGDGAAAESLLAELETCALPEIDHARAVLLRAVNMLFTLADPEGAKSLIDRTAPASAPVRRCIAVFRCIYWASMGRPATAVQQAAGLGRDESSDHLRNRLTSWALTVAHGEAGCPSEATHAAEMGYPVPVRGFIVIAEAHADALLLAGQMDEARRVVTALRQRALAAREGPFGAAAEAVSGHVELFGGQVDTACTLLTSAVSRVTPWSAAAGFRYRYLVLLMTALAMRGSIADAMRVHADLTRIRHPGWRHVDYACAIADGWLLGAQGSVREAIDTVRTAAETCRGNGQYATEVLCLQTATQFGDASTAERLHALEYLVEGPRVGVAARFAAALRTADSDELDCVSVQLEKMGDLVGAVDAAAHAASCYRRRNLRGSALRCSARAEALATRCGGVLTPTFRQSVDMLPLTERERQVVMLLGESLSNRDIAGRLTVSVRTVESHVYKAMAKTGATTRAELAALVANHDQHRDRDGRKSQ